MGRNREAAGDGRKPEPPPSGDIHGIQGEGNREADRRYREGARRFAESGRVDDAAREARESVEGDGDDPGQSAGPGLRDEEREPDDEEGAL